MPKNRNTILALVVGLVLTLSIPALADSSDAGESEKVFIYQQDLALHLAPNGYHIGTANSRVDGKAGEARDPHEAWLVTSTGKTDKNGFPTVYIESLNRSVRNFKYLAIAGTVEDGPKDPKVVGHMQISLSDKPFEWYAEKATSGVTLNVANAGGYVLEFREGICVLGWDNDTPNQLVTIKPVD